MNTGLSVSILGSDAHQDNFEKQQLKPLAESPLDYSQQHIPVKGYLLASAAYKHTIGSILFNTGEKVSTILGLDGIVVLCLTVDENSLPCFATTTVPAMMPQQLMEDFLHIFPEELKLAKGVKHKVRHLSIGMTFSNSGGQGKGCQ